MEDFFKIVWLSGNIWTLAGSKWNQIISERAFNQSKRQVYFGPSCDWLKDKQLLVRYFLNLNFVQVNLFQKHLFLYQLTHNMTKDCSLNYEFSIWKFQAQNMLCTQIIFCFDILTIYVSTPATCSEHVLRINHSELAIFMNNLLPYCGLVDARISASEKDLPVKLKLILIISIRHN